VYGVLPEILGKWYAKQSVFPTDATSIDTTKPKIAELSVVVQDDQEDTVDVLLWCYCKQPENDDSIACDYSGCSIEWYHITFLKLKSVPKGKWYCPGCRKKFL